MVPKCAPGGEGPPAARRPQHRTPRRKRQLGDTLTRRALERTNVRNIALGDRLRGGTSGQWQRRTWKLEERASDLEVQQWKAETKTLPELDRKDENERKDNRRKGLRSEAKSRRKKPRPLRLWLNEGRDPNHELADSLGRKQRDTVLRKLTLREANENLAATKEEEQTSQGSSAHP